MSEESLREDLERHPELTPLLDVNSRGEIECFGWVSPIYDYPKDLLPPSPRKKPDGNA